MISKVVGFDLAPNFYPVLSSLRRLIVGFWAVGAMALGVEPSRYAGISFIGALMTDYIYTNSPDMQWTNFSAWLLLFGMVFATIAGVFEIVSLIFERPHRLSAMSYLYGPSLLSIYVLALFNNLVHTRDAWASVVPTGLGLSVATVCAVILAAILRTSSSAIYRVKE